MIRVTGPAIRLASQLFHEYERQGQYYDEYLQTRKRWQLWDEPGQLHGGEMVWLIDFLNKWSTRYEDSEQSRQRLLEVLRQTLPIVNAFRDQNILDIHLDQQVAVDKTVKEVVGKIFDAIANCQTRSNPTAASKILHTVNPELFVMWDKDISCGYALPNRDGYDYASRFLPRIQQIARKAIAESAQADGITAEQAVERLIGCGHTLAKVLDEYNYCKFTLHLDEVWDAELGKVTWPVGEQ